MHITTQLLDQLRPHLAYSLKRISHRTGLEYDAYLVDDKEDLYYPEDTCEELQWFAASLELYTVMLKKGYVEGQSILGADCPDNLTDREKLEFFYAKYRNFFGDIWMSAYGGYSDYSADSLDDLKKCFPRSAEVLQKFLEQAKF